MIRQITVAATLLSVLCTPAFALPQTPAASELVSVEWLEPAGATPAKGSLPLVSRIPANDPRLAGAARMLDNEAARFVRTLIAAAWRRTEQHRTGPLPPLPILIQQGGNNARQGFQLVDEGKTTTSDLPYVVLELDADRLSLTLLHEGGHVADRIVRANRRAARDWSPLPHSTFAVTDPATALSEGFAIQLETLWGHYGSAPDRRAYYHRTHPAWKAETPIRSELMAPVRDVMTFSQNWARYQAVRDGLPAFEGHVYPGDYLRSQYDPARDRSRLRTGSAMVASEGTVASALFWIAQGTAARRGALEGRGLDQPGVLEGELELLAALQTAAGSSVGRIIDIVEVVSAVGRAGSDERRDAVERFVTITKGATARGDGRSRWEDLYRAAISLDLARARSLAVELDTACRDIIDRALQHPGVLRSAVGPLLPVRLDRAQVSLKALGSPFAIEMDLNAAGAAELHQLTNDADARGRVQRALDQKPFESYADFERRTELTLKGLGAEPIRP